MRMISLWSFRTDVRMELTESKAESSLASLNVRPF